METVIQNKEYDVITQGGQLYFRHVVSDYMSHAGVDTPDRREFCKKNFKQWCKNHQQTGHK